MYYNLIFKNMKKVLLILMAFCVFPAVFSQETAKVEPKNELKLNLFNFLLLYPEISYERILADDLGVGVSAAFSLDNDIETNFQITPYFRFYFGSKPAKTFFIEANMALVGFKEYDYDYLYPYYDYLEKEKNSVDFGLGLALGYKYYNRKGFTGEIYAGLGRTFSDYDRFYPRVGITIGKQF
jgi:hypothetical protein